VTRRLFSLLLSVALLGVAAPAFVAAGPLEDARAEQAALQAEIAAQQAALKALTKEAASLKASIASTRASLAKTTANLDRVRGLINTLDARIDAVRAKLGELDSKIAVIDGRIATLRAEQTAKSRELEARISLLRQRLREAYIAGRIPAFVGLVISADGSILDAALDASLLTRLGEEDVRLANGIREDRELLVALEASEREGRDAVAELRRLADEQRDALATSLADAAQLRTTLDKLAAAQKTQLAALAQNLDEKLRTAAELKKIVTALRQDEAEIASRIAELTGEAVLPENYAGSFSWPMDSYRISQQYGCTKYPWYPAARGCRYFHNGIDLSAPLRTPIRAIAPGEVIAVGRCGYCSVWRGYKPLWWVWVAHSKHLVSLYAHVDDGTYGKPPVVKKGDWVVEGQVIAYNGLTGSTTGPHLHFGMYEDGSAVNPNSYLP
jgi:murein DD-endopeptidase MepM/ murein hydrolase activator NlpD